MPPKKDAAVAAGGDNTITGFDARETKWLAAAFVASINPGKFDYKLFADLAKSTPASVQKLFPPIKRKAADAHPSFATYLGMGTNNDSRATAPKANGSKKRKAADTDGDNMDSGLDGAASDEKEKAKTRGKGRSKKVKASEQETEPDDEI